MKPDPKIIAKLETLTNDMLRVLQPTGLLQGRLNQHPDKVEVSRIRTEALNVIGRVHGHASDHYKSATAVDLNRVTDSMHLLGVLRAAKTDYEHGFLFDLKALVTAEVLNDFMEQAEALLEANFHVPAASLLGAVLEDALRKLSDKVGVTYPAKTKLDTLNIELAKTGVYDKLIQKRITALGDIRNSADHGHFDKFKRDDVEDMLKYVRRFMADYLS